MHKPILLLALLAPLAVGQTTEIPPRLTLSDAVSIALRQGLLLRRAAAALRQSEGAAQQAESQWYPQFSFGYRHSGQTVNLQALGINVPFLPGRVGPFEALDARVFVSQNIVNVPLLERRRAARSQRDSAASLAANAREDLAYQVAVLWTNALRAQQLHATLAGQTELSRKLAQITADRRDMGVASEVEWKRSLQQVNNLEQSLAEAENNLVAAKLQLAVMLNATPSSEFELVEEPAGSIMALPGEDALAAAFASRLDYRAARQAVEAAARRLAAARAQRYPVVQFRADWGQSGVGIARNLSTYSVQGSVTVPLSTGGRIAGEIVEAEGRLAEAQALLDEIRLRVTADVRAALAAAGAARRELDISSRTVELAREELELVTLRFTSGAADNTEVVNAQDRLTRAEDARVRAQFHWRLAQAALHRATGGGEKFYLSRSNP
jgi:outer membrane protein TolC